ncbi:unnamed protein product, partial [Didymodactylos carnosus]
AEEEIIDAQSITPSLYKYDIMISYSHTDKDLCYKIQEHLVKDKFRVWLDRDNLYGSQMQEMANAIENSEFIFICTSHAYKQSAYCQSEAHYAYERRCQLIPLKVIEKYRPDGWLGFILSGKVYIDFSKTDFDNAYQRLMSEIDRYRNQETTKQDSDHHLSHGNPTTETSENKPLNIASKEKTSSYDTIRLEQWTVENVVDFLNEMELDAMIPLYSMYQSLKSELNELQNKTLPIRVYVRFLDTLRKYVPITNDAQSVICNVM